MPTYDKTAREEEIKNRLRQDFFAEYDAAAEIGNIDFAVAVPAGGVPQLFETEYLLWAEAKRGTGADICESFVQLILTIGRARTFDHHLPPAFLGAFDAEKIAFIPYNSVLDIFYQNDFNWNVAPSDHTTREFAQALALVRETLEGQMLRYRYDRDEKELRRFIRDNFIVGKSDVAKIRISKNNFVAIYQKWLVEVKPSIEVNWEAAKQKGIIDADFYLADILSEHNVTLKEKLYVLLRKDYYELDRRTDDMGLFNSRQAQFNDGQVAHRQFWNRYCRPPRREYWDYIVGRRDLLVPQDVRERKGSFFTPSQWVELSQQYLAAELGDDWQEEYTVWDCCAGTGNLLVGLTNKWNVWASTLDRADVDVMHDRIRNGANLLDSHVFQFDFLNDPFSKLPKPLQDIINDPDRRRKLVIYINPPYAEAASKQTVTGKGANKTNVAVKMQTYTKYLSEIGIAGRELFAQFFIRIYYEIPSSVLAEFSTLKILQAPNFGDFREAFRAKLGRNFLVPAHTFDNVNGQFPIGFFIWHLDQHEIFTETISDIYDSDGKQIGRKSLGIERNFQSINDWIITTRNRLDERHIGYMSAKGSDFQNTNYIFIINDKNQLPHPRGTWITDKNISEIGVYMAVRHCIEATWLNDRDQFLYPNDGWKEDKLFQTDCLAYTLFCNSNNIQSRKGVNHWIPFTEAEVDAKDKFQSHFMSDYLRGKLRPDAGPRQGDLFATAGGSQPSGGGEPLTFSPQAQAVIDAGRELWRYYHAQPGALADASLYDIRLHFQGTKTLPSGKEQMNPDSPDPRYTELLRTLRQAMRVLAAHIEPMVYAYGFLKP